jgi:hypothetical protein
VNVEPVTWLTTHGDKVTVYGHLVSESTNWGGQVWDWRWHVQARNNRIVEQGEGHPRKSNAVRAALRHHPRVEP